MKTKHAVFGLMTALCLTILLVGYLAISNLVSAANNLPPKKYAEGDKIVLVLGEVEGMIVSTSWIHGEDGYKVRILTKGPNGQVTVTEQIMRDFEIKRKTR